MADIDKALWDLIQSLSKKAVIKTIQVGAAADVTDTTCTVKREGQPDLLGVRLNAIDDNLETYATTVPKTDSSVLVAIIENIKTEAVVISCSEVEKIIWKCGNAKMEFKNDLIQIEVGTAKFQIQNDQFTWNNGTNGGMVKITPLNNNFTTLTNYITALVSAISTALTTVDGVAGSVSVGTFNGTMAALNMNLQNMENTKLKH